MGLDIPTGPRGGTHRAHGSNIPTPRYDRYRVNHAAAYSRGIHMHFLKQLYTRQLRVTSTLIHRWAMLHQAHSYGRCSCTFLTVNRFMDKFLSRNTCHNTDFLRPVSSPGVLLCGCSLCGLFSSSNSKGKLNNLFKSCDIAKRLQGQYSSKLLHPYCQVIGWMPHVELEGLYIVFTANKACLLYTSPSPRDRQKSRMPSSA